jgi:tetratricopeptide (TPR) repeat protein
VNLALVALALAGASTAHAAPSRSVAVDPVDHYEAGKRLFEHKQYARALEEFRRALEIAPRREVLYSMAQAQRMLGNCVDAVVTYRAFLAGSPDEPFAGYARLNIERCERVSRAEPGPGEPVAWYRDVAGDVLVGAGASAGLVGALVWRSGRSAAQRLSDAPDYQSFVERRAAASSATTEQRLGIAAMIVGGVAIVGGIVHYAVRDRSARRGAQLDVSVTASSAMITGRVAF